MSTYDGGLLAARFAALAPEPLPGDWSDVVGRADAMPAGHRPLGRIRAHEVRRRRLLVVLAVVGTVALAAASAFAVRAFLVDRGFIGLPPQGATPSDPTKGTLAMYYRVEGPLGANPRRSQAWVYTDGRMIWLRETNPDRARLRGAANRWTTGFLEQRLTPKGVELLRAEIISHVGLRGEGRPSGSERIPFYVTIAVRKGDRLVSATWARDLPRLETRLWNPAAWLPASAWAQRRTMAYVPTRYQVCYTGLPLPLKPSRILPLLPPAAADVLRTKGRTRREGSRGWAGGPYVKSVDYCSAVTTSEARGIAKALTRAGAKQPDAVQLNFRVEVPGPKVVDPIQPDHAPVRRTVGISFEPYLPHARAACSPCG